MFTLVTGGSASGKSEYAERQVMALDGRRIYLAAMEPWDEECRRRIAAHREARAGRGFDTVECYRDLWRLKIPGDIPEGANVLLEDLGNLTANEMFGGEGGLREYNADPGRDTVLEGIFHLLGKCRHLTVVTNEVFSDGTDYGEETVCYLRELARISRELAEKADRVVEVVCGLPNMLKDSCEAGGAGTAARGMNGGDI